MPVKHAGLTQRAVSARLGLRTGAAVSYQVRRLESAMERDEALRGRVNRISNKLERVHGRG
jgi:hypothetical protein